MSGGGGAHDVPWDIKSASLEKFVPPWMVQRQVWSDLLKANHSGISTDVLLFSDINVSLAHHYQVQQAWGPAYCFPKGLPDLPASLCVTSGGPVSA